jgi:hypothetical protein
MRVMCRTCRPPIILGWRSDTARGRERLRGASDRRRVGRLAITALLLVRRHAPDGSYFNDGDRAAGVFGVLATGFAVLLGLVVVLAFTSYDDSRTGAETEAITLAQQYEVAHPFQRQAGAASRQNSSATAARSSIRSGRGWKKGPRPTQ